MTAYRATYVVYVSLVLLAVHGEPCIEWNRACHVWWQYETGGRAAGQRWL